MFTISYDHIIIFIQISIIDFEKHTFIIGNWKLKITFLVI